MSRNQRITLVVAALAVAVVAFVIARPGGDDEPEQSAATTTAQTKTEAGTGDDSAEPQPTTQTEPPPKPKVTLIEIKGGTVAGGAKTIEVQKGDTVRIVVSADAPDQIHLHGYDIERTAGPGHPARFRFKANAEGGFEIESHTAEDAGLDPLVARLVVAPS
jgi:FtsP/CotA-like multicopper oxidase with cupredoxin domain